LLLRERGGGVETPHDTSLCRSPDAGEIVERPGEQVPDSKRMTADWRAVPRVQDYLIRSIEIIVDIAQNAAIIGQVLIINYQVLSLAPPFDREATKVPLGVGLIGMDN